jgi:hypothetical protein
MKKKINSVGDEEISMKSTKEQILNAYQAAMTELEDRQVDEPSVTKQNEKKIALVNKAKQTNADSIVNVLANLKLDIIKQIDGLSEQLISEFTKLTEIQEAVAIEQNHLKELYDINETTKTLSALILAQQEKKDSFEQHIEEETERFEQEMEQKKEQWKQQQEALTAEYKEIKEQLEKNRKREEEDYKYNLDLKRKKEADEYMLKKTALEKELIDMRGDLDKRAEVIKNQEVEFVSMQQKIVGFAKEIAEVREETAKNISNQLETQHNHTIALRDKEVEGECKLSEQKIVALESKIKEQEQLVLQLTQKADTVVTQIQAIACRALDTSAQRYNMPGYQSDEKLTKSGEK